MKYVSIVVLTILVLMSAAAGAAKVLKTPQEVEFFADAGLNSSWLVPLGVMQIAGGFLAMFPRSRQGGLAAMALGFLVSAVAIFMTGNSVFGAFSLTPILFSIFLFLRPSNPRT